MAKKKVTVNNEKEKWYQSRRVWGSVFSTASAILLLFIEVPYVDKIAAGCGLIAAAFGGVSYYKPKLK